MSRNLEHPPMHPAKLPVRRHVLVLAAYVVLGLILTYPLVLRSGTHVPGDGIDDPALIWNLWWVKFALVDRQVNPFACGWMFHPLGINLAFYTLTILNGLLSVPLQMVLGLVPASNLLLLSSFVLSGYGAYLLVQFTLGCRSRGTKPVAQRTSGTLYVVSRLLPSFLAGLIYAFSSSKLFYASLGQFNIASSQWIPFAVLYVLRAGRDRSMRSAGLAALFLLFQAYAELTFASFLFIFVALYAAYELVRKAAVRHAPGIAHDGLPASLFLRNMAVIAVIFALGITPYLANMLPDLRVEGDFFTTGGGFADVFSADLAGYLRPTQLHPLFGRLAAALPFPHDKGQHLYLGYSVMLLVALGLWQGRRSPTVRFWGLSALIFWLLTLGPTVRISGRDTGIPGPFALIAELPLLKGNRYPSRYSVMLILSCAVLAGSGLSLLFRGKAGRRRGMRGMRGMRGTKGVRRNPSVTMASALAVLVPALFLFEHLSIPLPLSDMRVPAIYEHIAAESGDFAVLELPIGWRNGARVLGKQDVIIMFEQWYQASHGKRLLGGNTSRNPEFKFQYFAQAPLLSSLIGVQNGHEIPAEVKAEDQALAAEVLRFLGVRYVVVHDSPASPALLAYAEGAMSLERVAEEEDIRLYRVALPPEMEQKIDLSTALGRMHLGEGWSPVVDVVQEEAAVWAQRRQARLLAALAGDEQRLCFRAWAPQSGQSLEVWVRGRRWASLDLAAGWGDYEVNLPAGAVQPGLNDFRLRFARLYPLTEVTIPGESGTEVAGQMIAPPIVVQSAGLETGGNDLGHIYVDGRDLSPNRRGYNVVALSSAGDVLGSENFDTHLDSAASKRLADFIAELPEGSIVAAAVADEASMNLGEDAVFALRSIGATGDLRGKFRWGHAVVGVKGGSPGQALEALGVLRPVAVHVGTAATEPAVAAAFAHFEFGVLP